MENTRVLSMIKDFLYNPVEGNEEPKDLLQRSVILLTQAKSYRLWLCETLHQLEREILALETCKKSFQLKVKENKKNKREADRHLGQEAKKKMHLEVQGNKMLIENSVNEVTNCELVLDLEECVKPGETLRLDEEITKPAGGECIKPESIKPGEVSTKPIGESAKLCEECKKPEKLNNQGNNTTSIKALNNEKGSKSSIPVIIEILDDEESVLEPAIVATKSIKIKVTNPIPHSYKLVWDSEIAPHLRRLQLLGSLDDFIQKMKSLIRINLKKEMSLINLIGFTNSISTIEKDYLINDLIPFLSKSALEIKELFPEGIKILAKDKNDKIILTKKQVLCLMANMFLCTIPDGIYRDALPLKKNFSSLLGNGEEENKTSVQKIAFFYNYFRRTQKDLTEVPLNIIFQRIPLSSIGKDDNVLSSKFWRNNKASLMSVQIRKLERFETIHGCLNLICVNRVRQTPPKSEGSFKYDDVLTPEWCPSQIAYLCNPETIISRLFMENVWVDDVIRIFGCEQFSLCEGFGEKLKFDRNHRDEAPIDKQNKKDSIIIEMNMKSYSMANPFDQFDDLNKEIQKACLAFRSSSHILEENEKKPILTGFWANSTDEFNHELKFIIEWIAASHEKRKLIFIVGNSKSMENLVNVVKYLKASKNIGKVYENLLSYKLFCDSGNRNKSLFEYLLM